MISSGSTEFRSVRPTGALAEFVDSLWLFSGYAPRHEFEHLLPAGKVTLVINLEEQPMNCYEPRTLALQKTIRGPMLCGVHAGYEVVDTQPQREVMGVEFRPGGAQAFFDLPLDEIQEQDLPLDVAWGGFAAELQDRLLEARSVEKRLAILERALLLRLRDGARLHPVIGKAVASLERGEVPVEIGALAAAAGWSDRYFIRTFSSQVGITPKIYGRIRRFQGVLQRLRNESSPVWADVALTGGYYDQAHLIREFRAFAGMTPTAYRKHQGLDMNHVPLPVIAAVAAVV